MTTRSLYYFLITLLVLLAGVALGVLVNIRSGLKADVAHVMEKTSLATPALPAPVSGSAADGKQAPDQKKDDQYVGVIITGTVNIAPQFEGVLEAVYVHLGDHLKKGDRIAKIDPSAINQQLIAAQASRRVAEAEERIAQLEVAEIRERYNRRKVLSAGGLLSGEEIESARMQVEVAIARQEATRARIAEQQSRIEQLRQLLVKTEILAPFEGSVAARYQEPGAAVHSGVPIISLMRLDELWVRFAVPETESSAVAISSCVSAYIDTLNAPVACVVERAAPGVDSMSQMITVEARLRMPSGWNKKVRPGLVARISLAPSTETDASQHKLGSPLPCSK